MEPKSDRTVADHATALDEEIQRFTTELRSRYRSGDTQVRELLIERLRAFRQSLFGDDAQPVSVPVAELQASEELNRRIWEAVPGGIVHVSRDGSVKVANEAACKLLGLSYNELTRRFTTDFEPETVHEDGSPFAAEDYPVTRALRTGESQAPATIGVRRPNGTIAWAIFTAVPVRNHDSGEVEGAVVTFLDISERKRAEAALRESEAKLRSVLDSAPYLIFMVDRQGRILFKNQSQREPAGAPALGSSLFEFVGSAHVDEVRRELEEVFRTGELRSFEALGQESSEPQTYSVRLAPVQYEDTVVAVSGVAQNVTVQKQIQARLMLAERMASIGTLAAGVAHEINNPLTYVMANLDWLQRELSKIMLPFERVRFDKHLSDALDGIGRIRRIVDDLRTSSHWSEAELVPVDAREVIDAATRMVRTQLPPGTRLVVEHGDIPRVLADPSRLGQVMLNLLVNASQSLADADSERQQVSVVTHAREGRVFIEVSDTGCGIPPELLKRVFEPFVTNKPSGVGTGLGLYICHNIIAALGGEISVESELGRGTTFSISLRAAPSQASAHILERPDDEASERDLPARVLVVDDESGILRFFQLALQEHDVQIAETGRGAMSLLQRSNFDVIFCDLMLPDMSGIEVYAFARRTLPKVAEHFVFMTGGAYSERARKFLESDQHCVLQKPFDAGTLRRLIQQRRPAR